MNKRILFGGIGAATLLFAAIAGTMIVMNMSGTTEVDWDKIDAEEAARRNKEVATEKASLDTAVTFPDSEWTVREVKDLGKVLENGDKRRETEGRFIHVAFDIANKSDADAILFEPAKVFDAAGTEYLDLDVQDDFLPEGSVTVTMTTMPKGETSSFVAIYEIKPDATGLELEARSFDAFNEKAQRVKLGL